jgi:LysM repeat protein
VAQQQPDWRRYAAPAAFLAVATLAIVLVASALHHATNTATTVRSTPAPLPAQPRPAKTKTTANGHRVYTVVAGDTFGVIAAKTGTTVAALERLNPGVSSTALHIGQKIRVA